MEESLILRDLPCRTEPLVTQEQIRDGSHAGELTVLIVDLREFFVPLGEVLERTLAGFTLFDTRGTKKLFKSDDPLIQPWRTGVTLFIVRDGAGEGPEPEGAPGIHRQAQPLIRSFRIVQFPLDTFTIHRVFNDGQVGSPDVDLAGDLLFTDLQTP